MTLQQILESPIINQDTTIIIRNTYLRVMARGCWFQDSILNHSQDIVESFSWQDDNTVHVDIKEVCND